MKGNKKILIVAVLLLLIAVSYGTYAIYKTSVTGSATVTAAKWDVAFKNGETTLAADYELAFSTTECTNNAHVKDGVIAPGASCSKNIILDAGTSEVDVAYEVTTGTIQVDGSAMDEDANPITATVSPANGSITYSNNTRQQTITVTIAWDGTDNDENPNAADTTIGKAASTITVPLTLVAKQDTSPTPTPQP